MPSIAIDTHFHSRFAAEGYNVRTRQGNTIDRRRLYTEFQLDTWNMWPGTDDVYSEGPWLSAAADFRIQTDFGYGDYELDTSRPRHYVPGLDRFELDAMYAYVDADGLWDDRVGLSAGRQILLDPCGWVSFDGAAARLRGAWGVELSVYGGLEVLGADTLGYDNFETDGTDRGDRSDLEPWQYPDRQPASLIPLVGTGLSFAPARWFRGDVAYRITNPGTGVTSERIAAGIEPGLGPVSIRASTAYDILIDQVSIIDAEVAVEAARGLTVFVDGIREKPVFGGDSIFNVFAFDPRNDLGAGARLNIAGEASVGTRGYVRLADDGYGISGEEDDHVVSGMGGSLAGSYGHPGSMYSMSMDTLAGYGDRYTGVMLTGEEAFLNDRFMVEGRASVWHTRNSFTERPGGISGGYLAGLRYTIVQGADLWTEFLHQMSEDRGHHFEVLALLDLDLWW